jgi:hypothetical protein
MKRPKPLRNIWRKVWDPKNTILGGGAWSWPYLDTANWWQDSWNTDSGRYLHVEVKPPKEYGDHVTRVYPREKKGRTVTMGMRDGELYWIYSATKAETDAFMQAWREHEAGS